MVTRYKTPEYITWDNMQQRCTNPKNPAYENYGGRGITICERWNIYSCFLQDMGNKPTPAHEIERKDNNGNYTPENCCWIPPEKQGRNKRIYRTNKSGVSGVHFSESIKLWRVKVDGLFLYNGKDFFEACCVRKAEDARLTRRVL
jgi:hypothetical protein